MIEPPVEDKNKPDIFTMEKNQQKLLEMKQAMDQEREALKENSDKKTEIVEKSLQNVRTLEDQLKEESKQFKKSKEEQQDKKNKFQAEVEKLRDLEEVFEAKMYEEAQSRKQTEDQVSSLQKELSASKKEIKDLKLRLSIEKKKNAYNRTGMQKPEEMDKSAKALLKTPPRVRNHSDMVRNYKQLEDQLVKINQQYAELLEDRNHLKRSLSTMESQTNKQKVQDKVRVDRLENEVQRESEKLVEVKNKMAKQQRAMEETQREKRQLEINLRQAEENCENYRTVLESLKTSTLDVIPGEEHQEHNSPTKLNFRQANGVH
eukprot:gb/GECH01011776.1/.p1 GENE.gb/GECH01011776.1/~~gb/GECH01011776.1/.p1  ORF type:complete len:318 (+),score=121.74 gb/GECH01011776.1/:1-954(+)